MPLIDQSTIHALHTAALSTGLANSRPALMAGIAPAIVDGIDRVATSSAQLLVDLGALAAMGAIADGTVPLRAWLDNAARLTAGRTEEALFARIRDGLPTSASSSPATSVQVSIGRLPVTSPELFGREKELAWLDACWRDGVHLVSIVAWGGVGKSALVNAWLARVRDRGWDGAERVFGWSFYSQGTDRLTSSDEFFAVALREFGDTGPAPTSPWDKGERLSKLVRRERALLVLDGLEPLQWGPEQEGRLKDQALEALLKELAAQNKGTCVVASRIKVADLDGLGGDKVRALDLDHLPPESGAKLLHARGAKGLVEELEAASEEYDGHSLSLTLLGNYLRKAHKGDIRARRHIPLGERPAQRMMDTYEGWFRGKAELAILRLLGFFDRPAPEDEIAALLAPPVIAGLTDALDGLGKSGWNEAVTALQDVGLLAQGAEGDERLDAHPLVREHFGAQLRNAQPDAWREGHRRLYEHLKRKAKEYPETVEEMAPLYAAVVHGCMAGKKQEALDDIYYRRIEHDGRGFNRTCLGAFGAECAILAAFFSSPWDSVAPGLSQSWHTFVVNAAGSALCASGWTYDAERLLSSAHEQYLQHKHWEWAAVVASSLSGLLLAQGKLIRARDLALQGVRRAGGRKKSVYAVASRAMLATTLHMMGLPMNAAEQFEAAEKIRAYKQAKTTLLSSVDGFRFCDLIADMGDYVKAQERGDSMLERWYHGNRPLDVALGHLARGRVDLRAALHGDDSRFHQAADHIGQAVIGLRRSGRQDYLPLGLLARAAFRTYTHAFDAARHDLTEALTLSTRGGFRLHEADAHLGFALLALAERDPAAAADHLGKARAIIDATSYHRRDGELAELTAEARAMAEEISRKERKGGREERKEEDSDPLRSLRTFASFARNSGSASDASDLAPTPPLASSPAMPTPAHPNDAPVDFLIFAPLEEERVALLSKLPEPRILESDGTDVHVYFEAYLPTRRKDEAVYRILVTSPASMGPIHAAVTASSIAARWKPEHVLVVGIAGGLGDEVSLGDVMVARSVADYTVGKVREDGTREERWEMIPVDAGLLNFANAYGTGWEDLVKERRPGRAGKPTRYAGVIASGGDVITSGDLIAAYRRDMPKLIGVEMEGGGVATALHTSKLRPRFLMIRGVSDLADRKGNAATKKRWRAYARDVAAAYIVGLLRSGPVPAAQRKASETPR